MSKQLTKKAMAEVQELVAKYHTVKGAERAAIKTQLDALVKEAEFDLAAYIKERKPRSRRSIIIELVQEGIWDTGTLAEALVFYGYPDVNSNAKAVSGTLYDMKTNQAWVVAAERKHDTLVQPGIFVTLPKK
jgi:hypothetical protein